MKVFAVLAALAVLAAPALGQMAPAMAPRPPTPMPTLMAPMMMRTPPTPAPMAAPVPGRAPSPGSMSGSGGMSSSTTSSSGGGGVSSGGGSGSGPTDADVLMFAYNLECLEGNFYSCAAFGTPLDSSITGNGPAPSSCMKANLSSSVGSYAAELAREETAHVKILYQSLKAVGMNPVCPAVNIDSAFEAAAEAAFMQPGMALSPMFNPYANDVFFLHGAFIFEDLGASAYLGAQTLLQNATLRQVAGQIGNAESYHSSLDRTLLYQIIDTTPAYNKTVGQITSAIVAAVNMLAGSPQLKYELTNMQGASISNVDSNGFVVVATVAQVLKVVTLGAPAGNGGGFFPSNLVGTVKN